MEIEKLDMDELWANHEEVYIHEIHPNAIRKIKQGLNKISVPRGFELGNGYYVESYYIKRMMMDEHIFVIEAELLNEEKRRRVRMRFVYDILPEPPPLFPELENAKTVVI